MMNHICYEDKERDNILPKNTIVETQSHATKKQDSNYELSIYPNPTQSEMTVALNNPAVKIVQIEIYDLFGRKMVHKPYSNLQEKSS